MRFDPTTIHKTLKKIKEQSSELDELSKELETKCNKKECDQFPPNLEKPTTETEEL